MNAAENQDAPFYDVVVIGGALSGAATAMLLLRQNSGLHVLIVEKSVQLTRRVGEATVEVSAFLHGEGVGLDAIPQRVASREARLRFWFTNDAVKSLDEASELGGHYQVRLPSYQPKVGVVGGDRQKTEFHLLCENGAKQSPIRVGSERPR
jgi:2-polyprenyl-6-methoxyphenol hydroxylase-like FAD-dependent oxidoreductase